MTNKELMETLKITNVIKEIKEKDRKLLEETDINANVLMRKVVKYLQKMGVDKEYINKESWLCVVDFIRLCKRHELGMSSNEFIDIFLNFYDLRHGKLYKSKNHGLSNEIKMFDKGSKYKINIDELRIVNGADCIKFNGEEKYKARTINNLDGSAALILESGIHIGGLFVNGKDTKTFIGEVLSDNREVIDYLMHNKFDMVFLPRFKAASHDILKDIMECKELYEKMNNKEFIDFLRLIGALELNFGTNLIGLDKIENFKYDIKNILSNLCLLRETSEVLGMVQNIIRTIDEDNVYKLDKLNNLLELYKLNVHLHFEGWYNLFRPSIWSSIDSVLERLSEIDVKYVENIEDPKSNMLYLNLTPSQRTCKMRLVDLSRYTNNQRDVEDNFVICVKNGMPVVFLEGTDNLMNIDKIKEDYDIVIYNKELYKKLKRHRKTHE